MGNIILICVLAFLVLMAYRGYKRGVIKVVYSIVAIMISMSISLWLTKPVTDFLKNNTPVYSMIKKQMDYYVDKNLKENMDDTAVDIQKNSLETLSNSLDNLNLPRSITDSIEKNLNSKNIEQGTDGFYDYISESLTYLCMRACVTVVIMIILLCILRVLAVALDIFAKLPVINEVNKIIGIIIGTIEGILLVWVACLVLMACSGTPQGSQLMTEVSNNQILSFIFDNNIFVILLQNVIKL